MRFSILLSCLFTALAIRSAVALPVARDSASDAAYRPEAGGAWKGLLPSINENPPGMDNGGFGFHPWSFEGGFHDATASPYGQLNHFIDGVDFLHSPFNNLDAPAFGLTNGNLASFGFTARATRVFAQPLAVGGTFSFQFDNSVLAPMRSNDETGYVIRLNSGGGPKTPDHPDVQERLGFFATDGFNQNNWNRTDAAGVIDTGLSSVATTSGAVFRVTLETAATYRLEVLPLAGGTPLYSATGDLIGLGAGGIDTLEILMFGNGSGNGILGLGGLPTGQREFFFNNLVLDNPLAFAAGDYNRDGVVDAADYPVWRKTLNQIVPLGDGADGNRDGVVNELDYNVWRQNFGLTSTGAGAGVEPRHAPEPTSSTFLALAAIVAMRLRVRRQFA